RASCSAQADCCHTFECITAMLFFLFIYLGAVALDPRAAPQAQLAES
ncbi:MAG: hypothetical protein GY938_03830, partial [Ketobacter sp.]|nr:hypothetical protein [Ketobacter sp.]